jgi:hypothetical protein
VTNGARRNRSCSQTGGQIKLVRVSDRLDAKLSLVTAGHHRPGGSGDGRGVGRARQHAGSASGGRGSADTGSVAVSVIVNISGFRLVLACGWNGAGPSAWELSCHASLTGASQVRWRLRLSVGTRQRPPWTGQCDACFVLSPSDPCFHARPYGPATA